jgi:Zn-dependent protease with chaperone function
VTGWLRKFEETKAAKTVDAHIVRPLLDDVTTRTLAVEGLEVTEEQFPELNAIVMSCVHILHLERKPRVFISEKAQLPVITENCVEPVIVVEASVLTRFRDPPELRFLIGRELGHIQAGHVRWLSLIRQIQTLPSEIALFGGADTSPILLPLMHFAKGCEMTADNAGLICAQDRNAAERVLVQLATGIDGASCGGINIEAYLKQTQTVKLSDSSELVVLWRGLRDPVPFAPDRIRQLRQYQASAKFRALWK